MPQFALLLMLVLLPLQMLSGGSTPRESMPAVVQSSCWRRRPPTSSGSRQAILFRGAGLAVVWPQYAALAVIGAVLLLPVPGPLPQDHRGHGMSRRVLMRSTVWVLVILLLPGCMVGPEYHRPGAAVPADWRTGSARETSLADLAWSKVFNDPALQELIRAGMEASWDVQMAVARVFEARARLGVARAALFPAFNAGFSYSYERPYSPNSYFLESFPGVSAPTGNDIKTGVDFTFELDLWGRLRRATEAARAELLASEDSWRSVRITLIADIARTYFNLLELDQELEISRRTLATRQASLDLQRRRAEQGLSTQLDVQRAAAEVAVAAATIPDLERLIAQTENGLNVLLGRNPGPVRRGAPLDAQRVPPEVPAGLPSESARASPGHPPGRAERHRHQRSHRGGQGRVLSPHLPHRHVRARERVPVGPLYRRLENLEGGAHHDRAESSRRAGSATRSRRERRSKEHAVARYRQTIQRAFREVDDALVFHRKVRESRAEQALRVAATRQALYLANLRYERGLATYLDVLDQERRLFRAELDLASTTRDQLTAVVQVYKVLGGGW